MRCSTCKNCLSAIKKGHFECLKTFNYKKSKNAVETAARGNKRDIYNFLKEAGCPRSFVDEIHSCADYGWNDEFYSFFRFQTPDYESKLKLIREMTYAAIKYGDMTMMRSVLFHYPSTVRDAFDDIEKMHRVIKEVIKSEHVQKIELIYNTFRYRSQDWSPSDFEDAIDTGNVNTLKCVIHMWKESFTGLRGTGNEMKLATIKHNRLDMLRILDQDIHGYPTQMTDQMKTTRGKTSQARKEMIRYVTQQEYLVVDRARERNAERRHTLFNIEADIILERQAAPAVERVTNLHKALAIIEDCKIPEGKYLELCNLLMDVHRRGVIIM
jgi:hypothetical protein